jgi:flagellar basal-body rod modification protein FlgD
MSSPISNPLAASTPATPAITATNTNLANQNVFMQLLVAQLENQDPQNPADGTQFVTQLAQFTTLQENTQSTQDLGSILQIMQPAAPVTPAVPATSTTPGTTATKTL